MNSSPENQEQRLERLIGKTLRELPPRRAPGTLEHRVLAAIEHRAALPWWRKSYLHWPLAVRCAFLIASGGVAQAVLMMLGDFKIASVIAVFAPQLARLQVFADLAISLVDFCRAVVQSIPPLWLYGGLAGICVLYATLFGVGAFAYRTLYARR
jgi:hypothetical protein